MYFLEQMRCQFMTQVVNYNHHAEAGFGPEEPTADTIEGPKSTDDEAREFLETWDEAREVTEWMERRAAELDAGVRGLEWEDTMKWDDWADVLYSPGTVEWGSEWPEKVKQTNEELLEWLSEKPPFNTLSPEERQEVLAQIEEAWLEIPEGMTREEAFEEAFNNALEKEAVEYQERIDQMLEDEAIELSEEQRTALSEFLEWIEDPTMQDIENFLNEQGMTTVVDDNPNTPENEAWGPNFATRLYSSMDSYSHLPSSRWSYSGDNPYTWEVFRWNAWLNEQFYDVEKIRSELPQNLRVEADKLAEEITQWIESQWWNAENWIWALYRNASNNPNFSSNQPVLLHNLSTATAMVSINGRVQLCAATHGKWVGNTADSWSTPVGSFQMYGMSNGKYQARMWVKGLEEMKQNMANWSEEEAYNMDPSQMWNANSDNRLIRVHEARGSRTLGCSGLPTEIAKQLANATRDSRIGIMERFVSNPTG